MTCRGLPGLRFLEDLGLFANQVQQPERGASRVPAALLPTDGGHLGDIEQTRKHGLADIESLTQGGLWGEAA